MKRTLSPQNSRRATSDAGMIIRRSANDQPLLRDHDSDVLQGTRRAALPARYGGQVAVFRIESFERIRGELPRRAERLVREWADLHRDELMRNWEQARAGRPLAPIDPLA
jgi:hypothetical protein